MEHCNIIVVSETSKFGHNSTRFSVKSEYSTPFYILADFEFWMKYWFARIGIWIPKNEFWIKAIVNLSWISKCHYILLYHLKIYVEWYNF